MVAIIQARTVDLWLVRGGCPYDALWHLPRGPKYPSMMVMGPKSYHGYSIFWVAVKELNLSYHNPKTKLFDIYA